MNPPSGIRGSRNAAGSGRVSPWKTTHSLSLPMKTLKKVRRGRWRMGKTADHERGRAYTLLRWTTRMEVAFHPSPPALWRIQQLLLQWAILGYSMPRRAPLSPGKRGCRQSWHNGDDHGCMQSPPPPHNRERHFSPWSTIPASSSSKGVTQLPKIRSIPTSAPRRSFVRQAAVNALRDNWTTGNWLTFPPAAVARWPAAFAHPRDSRQNQAKPLADNHSKHAIVIRYSGGPHLISLPLRLRALLPETMPPNQRVVSLADLGTETQSPVHFRAKGSRHSNPDATPSTSPPLALPHPRTKALRRHSVTSRNLVMHICCITDATQGDHEN